jgi:hypothetical protein
MHENGAGPRQVRIIVIAQRTTADPSQPNTYAIPLSSVLQNWDTGGTVPDINMLSPKSHNNLVDKYFLPMYDKVFNLNGYDKQDRQVHLRFSGKRLPHKKLHFDGTSVFHEWVYFLYAISTDNITPFPTISIYARMTWTDV